MRILVIGLIVLGVGGFHPLRAEPEQCAPDDRKRRGLPPRDEGAFQLGTMGRGRRTRRRQSDHARETEAGPGSGKGRRDHFTGARCRAGKSGGCAEYSGADSGQRKSDGHHRSIPIYGHVSRRGSQPSGCRGLSHDGRRQGIQRPDRWKTSRPRAAARKGISMP